MISNVVDFTDVFNLAGLYNIDLGDWDYAVVQLIAPTAAVTFSATNDASAVTGGTDGSPLSATNWVTVLGTNLTTGTTAVSTSASNSLFKFNVVGKFLQLGGVNAATQVTKALVYFAKIK